MVHTTSLIWTENWVIHLWYLAGWRSWWMWGTGEYNFLDMKFYHTNEIIYLVQNFAPRNELEWRVRLMILNRVCGIILDWVLFLNVFSCFLFLSFWTMPHILHIKQWLIYALFLTCMLHVSVQGLHIFIFNFWIENRPTTREAARGHYIIKELNYKVT